MTAARFERLAVAGVGLIGGSLALAAREAGLAGEVVGIGRRPERLRRAAELGVVDRWTTEPAEGVAGADLVVLAVPLGAMRALMEALAPGLGPEAVVTDVGSAKRAVVEDARAALGDAFARFVPGHPVAGTERSGVEAAFATLFRGRRVILTPVAETAPEAVARVRALWEAVGAEVVEMDPARHDRILAATSHLPHVLAYTLVDLLAGLAEHEEVFANAAGGFRDFTRIASSDPVMWRDICLANREAIVEMLDRYGEALAAVRAAVAGADGAALERLFARAKAARDAHAAGREEG
ncbi:MAG TPA: prephenate dehydrogenase/arogenate dehydrogenase family protein [Chromatiales bacterium]|nr:prephenate dehydrogenase/arogenate dehydrogenase family protein [Chromatiales bacterium]